MNSTSVKVIANACAFTTDGKLLELVGNGPKVVEVGKITMNKSKEGPSNNIIDAQSKLSDGDEMLKW